MNEKTAKLIRQFAQATGQSERDLKRRWNGLDDKGRSAFRAEMTDRASAEGGAGAQGESQPAEDSEE
ncbi:MAG: hypothetical protein ACFB9M_13585 [Myxococcota bacterium]